MTWDITNNLYDDIHIKFNNGIVITYVPKFRIYMTVTEPYLYLYWTDTELGSGGITRLLQIDFNDVSSLPASAAALQTLIEGYITSGFTGGTVQSVTGLDTDNTDPANPVVQISVDGVTITGDGTPGNPLVSAGGGDSLSPLLLMGG